MRYFDLHVDSLLAAEISSIGIDRLSDSALAITADKLAHFESAAITFSIWSGNHFQGDEAVDHALVCLGRASEGLVQAGLCVSPGSREEASQSLSAGRPLAFFGIEGGFALNGNPSITRKLRTLGVIRYTLTHFDSPGWIGSDSQDDSHRLTEVGREVVSAMNDCGIIPDVSHANESSMLDVLACSTSPVVYSHGGPRELSRSNRGISDRAMKGIAQSGGLIGLSLFPHHHTQSIEYAPGDLNEFFSKYEATRKQNGDAIFARRAEAHVLLSEYPKPVQPVPLDRFVESYRYAVNLVGEDCVSIGSDLDGSPFYFAEIRDCADSAKLADLLNLHGIHSNAIDKLFWSNAERVILDALR